MNFSDFFVYIKKALEKVKKIPILFLKITKNLFYLGLCYQHKMGQTGCFIFNSPQPATRLVPNRTDIIPRVDAKHVEKRNAQFSLPEPIRLSCVSQRKISAAFRWRRRLRRTPVTVRKWREPPWWCSTSITR